MHHRAKARQQQAVCACGGQKIHCRKIRAVPHPSNELRPDCSVAWNPCQVSSIGPLSVLPLLHQAIKGLLLVLVYGKGPSYSLGWDGEGALSTQSNSMASVIQSRGEVLDEPWRQRRGRRWAKLTHHPSVGSRRADDTTSIGAGFFRYNTKGGKAN